MADKKYIGGSAKAVSTQYGEILNLSLKIEDMQAIANEKGYVNMTVLKRKEPGQYGDTHYVVENDYQKNREEGGGAPAGPSTKAADIDVPF
ncbi:hypothetical protein KBB89_02390 [Candidatus Gracilibacteria bacterium]|nr:hypothetical protein [Candidatus Gracilibacteria bacterium]